MAIANIVKENAAKAGFDIQLDVIDPGQVQQDLRQHNYQIMPLRISFYPSPDDPFTLWHSTNDSPGAVTEVDFIHPNWIS